MKTAVQSAAAELCRVARDLESSLSDRLAQLIVHQDDDDDPSRVRIECVRCDAVQGRAAEAAATSGVLALRDGDVLELSMRGNLEFDAQGPAAPRPPRRFVFHSHLTSPSIELYVREVSPFAQV